MSTCIIITNFLKKIIPVFLLFAGAYAAQAGETVFQELASPLYEYKIVPLGSLTALQKKAESETRTREVESVLNREGQEGWEMVNIFAVRTTFDPNVFFAVMKRPLPDSRRGNDQP
jgi:hypothetical protein